MGKVARETVDLEEGAVQIPETAQVHPSKIWDALTLHEQDDIGGHDDQIITVDQLPILIKRERMVPLRRTHVIALENAVKTTYVKDDKGNDIPKNVPRFHFTIHKRDLTPQEVKAIMETGALP